MKLFGKILAFGFVLGFGSAANADLIMDQIGSASNMVLGDPNTSQIFEPMYAASSVAVLDNFSITNGPTTLTEVDAATLGFAGFSSASYGHITAWDVEIYSSISAGVQSLTGDVASFTVAPSSVTLTTPFTSEAYSALVEVPVNVTLGNGTYYVAVIAALNVAQSEEIGVYESRTGTPGDSNAYQVNPGGGLGLPGNEDALGVNAAYRIIGTPAAVPEPSPTVLASVVIAAALFATLESPKGLRTRAVIGRGRRPGDDSRRRSPRTFCVPLRLPDDRRPSGRAGVDRLRSRVAQPRPLRG